MACLLAERGNCVILVLARSGVSCPATEADPILPCHWRGWPAEGCRRFPGGNPGTLVWNWSTIYSPIWPRRSAPAPPARPLRHSGGCVLFGPVDTKPR
jgi:hypothetical protein